MAMNIKRQWAIIIVKPVGYHYGQAMLSLISHSFSRGTHMKEDKIASLIFVMAYFNLKYFIQFMLFVIPSTAFHNVTKPFHLSVIKIGLNIQQD